MLLNKEHQSKETRTKQQENIGILPAGEIAGGSAANCFGGSNPPLPTVLGRDITRKLLLRSVPVKWCSYIGDSSYLPRSANETLEDKVTVDGFGSAVTRKLRQR